jgi:hypothetical protein
MAPECRFILANGRKCRGAAIRHHDFCRHHGPQSALLGPPPQSNPFTALKKWRSLGRSMPWLHPAEIPFAVYEILDSLTGRKPNDRLSDRTAGRYLRALLSQLRLVPFPRPAFPPPPAALPAPPATPAAAPAGRLPPELRSAVHSFLAHPQFNNHSLDTLIDAFAKAGFDPNHPSPSSTSSRP